MCDSDAAVDILLVRSRNVPDLRYVAESSVKMSMIQITAVSSSVLNLKCQHAPVIGSTASSL